MKVLFSNPPWWGERDEGTRMDENYGREADGNTKSHQLVEEPGNREGSLSGDRMNTAAHSSIRVPRGRIGRRCGRTVN
jgi:hypothetical protein